MAKKKAPTVTAHEAGPERVDIGESKPRPTVIGVYDSGDINTKTLMAELEDQKKDFKTISDKNKDPIKYCEDNDVTLLYFATDLDQHQQDNTVNEDYNNMKQQASEKNLVTLARPYETLLHADVLIKAQKYGINIETEPEVQEDLAKSEALEAAAAAAETTNE
jgi:hypothetical protein